MFVFAYFVFLAAAAAQSLHPVGGNGSLQKSVQPSGPFAPTAVRSPAQGVPKVPQLSVADILALRRVVQKRQLISRSGVASPSSGRLPRPYAYNFVGDSVRSQFGDPSGPSYGDYLASASASPPKRAKPSISTRFRSFMNSLFFRTSGSVAPAFYQPAPSTMFRPGPASFLPQPAQQPRIPQGFASKSSANFPTSFGAPAPGKASFVPSYSSSVSSSSLKGSSSIASPVSAASDPQASVASGFYPSSIAGSSGSSYDKSRFSSLYGSNGFTAKASPVKSSKSIKTHIQTGASDEKFPEVVPTVRKPSQSSPKSSDDSKN